MLHCHQGWGWLIGWLTCAASPVPRWLVSCLPIKAVLPLAASLVCCLCVPVCCLCVSGVLSCLLLQCSTVFPLMVVQQLEVDPLQSRATSCMCQSFLSVPFSQTWSRRVFTWERGSGKDTHRLSINLEILWVKMNTSIWNERVCVCVLVCLLGVICRQVAAEGALRSLQCFQKYRSGP